MGDTELRAHFDLKPCPRKPHPFSIGRLIGEWVWAQDCWSQLVGNYLQTLWLSFHTTKSTDGITIYCFTAWKLKVIIGLL